jgi:hypothetical protein
MKICKHLFLLVVIAVTVQKSRAQEIVNLSEVDSIIRSQPGYVLKRGIYKNYQEFLNNSPSITREFKVDQKTKSEKALIKGICAVGLDVLSGQEKIGQVWGFCDGNAVYYNHSIFENKYWKLQYIGPNPFFFHGRQIRTAQGLLNAGFDGTFVDLYFITDKGKSRLANDGYLSRLFKSEPSLRDYDYDPNKKGDNTKQQYLRKYNSLTLAKQMKQ